MVPRSLLTLPVVPAQDPIAIIGVLAIFFPFVLLGIAAAFGLVDFSGGR